MRELPLWVSCKGVACQQGQEPLTMEAEEFAVLGAIAKQWLMKINCKDLVCAIVKCKVCELAIVL